MNTVIEFIHRIDLSHMALPIFGALFFLSFESVFLALRLWILIPRAHKIKRLDLMKLYYQSVVIAQLSYATLADIYRFRELKKLCPDDLHISERLEWMGVEKITEPLTLVLLGFLLVDFHDLTKIIPLKVMIPLFILAAAISIFVYFQKKKEQKQHKPRTISFKSMGIVLLITGFAWIFDMIALKCLTTGYSLSVSQLMLTMLALAMTSVPPLPWGRWGLFEGVVSTTLSSFGIPLPQAVAIAGIFHIFMLLPAAGFMGTLWAFKRFRQ